MSVVISRARCLSRLLPEPLAEHVLHTRTSSTVLLRSFSSTQDVCMPRQFQYHDAFPACRGGPTTREHMLDNERMRAKLKQLKTFRGTHVEPAEPLTFENRNPRHMELLGFNKPAGFPSLRYSRSFYNKLNLKVTERNGDDLGNTIASVENISGHVLCSASTTEFAIARTLHSPVDVMAAVNVARVLAQRCAETGIARVYWNRNPYHTKAYQDMPQSDISEKIREFERTLMQNGLTLWEPMRKVLEGAKLTLPPAPQHRRYPGPLNNYEKRRWTVARKTGTKQEPDWVEDLFQPGVDDRAPWNRTIDHQAPEL